MDPVLVATVSDEEPVPTKAIETGFRKLLEASFLLTIASFLASLGHFAYQLCVVRMLPLPEFGAFNTTLSLVLLLAVPLNAASQSIAHYLAKHKATDNHAQLLNLQAACQLLLRKWTWILCIASALLIYPLTRFFHFERATLMLAALACVPITLWSAVGTVWCTGLSRFKLLAMLNFLTMVVRFSSGVALLYFFPYAEAGVSATFFAGWVIAAVVIFGPKPDARSAVVSPWDREFVLYTIAALGVGLGSYIFMFGDQLIAQRTIKGDALGLYMAAGLLGRAAIMGSQPILLVYFTQRSGVTRSSRNSHGLIGLYVLALLVAIGVIVLFREPFSRILLGRAKMAMVGPMVPLVKQFAMAMIPLGILQALGLFYLASRRLLECYTFGVLGIIYALILLFYGKNSEFMVSLMFAGGCLSLLVLCMITIVRWSRKNK
jgi:O-antigen/teichoic acid export membrane protein